MKLNKEQKEARKTARQNIIGIVNEWRVKRYNKNTFSPLTMKHINEAVCIGRRNKLLFNETLQAAGFNGGKNAKVSS
jgi:hypothetical protein